MHEGLYNMIYIQAVTITVFNYNYITVFSGAHRGSSLTSVHYNTTVMTSAVLCLYVPMISA